jgi:transketolase
MKTDSKKIKMWSQIGPRATFGLACLDLSIKEDKLLVLTSDVSTSAGLDRYKKKYPEKYLDVGISEQNLIGVAAGLSGEGFKVVTTTFSPFQTLRCAEQIKVNLGYMKHKICLVGIASGVVLGTLGYTHCSIEDIAAIRSIPNISIVSPADGTEVVKAIFAAVNHYESVYLRLTGSSNNPIVYTEDYDFQIGKAVKIIDGKDISIFANGSMVSIGQSIEKILKTHQISTELINMHTVKPLDEDQIKKSCEKSKLIISLEEHSIIGGLGSSISEFTSSLNNPPKLLKFGLRDQYNISGDYTYMLQENNLTSEKIAKKILEELNKK